MDGSHTTHQGSCQPAPAAGKALCTAPWAERIKRVLLRDVIPTLLILASLAWLTLLASDLIENRNISAVSQNVRTLS